MIAVKSAEWRQERRRRREQLALLRALHTRPDPTRGGRLFRPMSG